MKVQGPSSFAAPIYIIVLLLALGAIFVVNARAPAEDDNPPELNRQIVQLYHEGKFKEAIPLAEKLVVLTKRAKGGEHPDTATSLNNLAMLYQAMGDYVKAKLLFKEALEIRQNVLGQEHPDTAQSINNLAMLYQAMGDYTKAEPLFKEALQIRQKVLGPEHPDTAQSLNNLAYLELDLGEIQEAERLGRLGYAAGVEAFSQILSFGSEDQRLAYQRLQNPYTLFAAFNDTDALMAGAVLHYKGIVLDSIIEDRLLAETGKEEANRDLVEKLNAKKRIAAQLSLQTTAASP